MDLSCIISSGDLELYVLGMLPQDEAAKIEQLALLFPEIQEELDRISETLLVVGETAHLAPSPGIKAGLMQQLAALGEAEDALATPVVPIQSGRNLPLSDADAPRTEAPVVAMTPPVKRRAQWLSAASFIGLLLALGGLLFLASRNRQQTDALAEAQRSNLDLNRKFVEAQRRLNSKDEMIAMLQSDVFKKIKLTAVPGKPDALVQLMWNTQTKAVYVSNLTLPQAPSGRQYQLWAIVDGKPVDAGTLNSERGVVQTMKTFNRAEAFAITLEQAGGSPTPTLEQMYVMGAVS